MNNGRGWRGRGIGGPGMWERGAPPAFRQMPPPYRGGFGPRPPVFFPGAPPPWRGPGRGRGGRGGFSPRGGIDKRFVKFGRGGGSGGKHQWKNQNRIVKDTPGPRLTEQEIGVTEYIGSHAGFNGIIKSRYADFQVSEINESGEVAKLTDTSVPEPPRREEVSEDEELLLSKYNLELLPLETWDKINSLAVCREPTTERLEVDVTGMSKEERTRIHDSVKKAFGDAIVGSTVTTNEKKLVRFEKFRKGVRIDNRIKWVWAGDYVHFIVHKENCDTMDAAGKIAERLMMSNVKSSMLGYSGTKDRRAKSSQWFSLRRTEPRRIAAACKDFREIHVGNFTFSDTHLKLGMLRGNRFRIALRNVTAADAEVDTGCENLREHGFINYYGLQRFGTRADTPTYSIGLKLLQGKFKEAIDDILEPREGPSQQALQAYRDTRDAAAAVKYLRRYCHKTLEGRLLRSLSREPNDMVGALNKLARNTRLLYVHSYQSLVWNRCVSHRLRLLGHKPAVGDLVLEDPCVLEEPADEAQDDDSEDEDEKPNIKLEEESSDTEQKPETDTAADETNGSKTATNGNSRKEQVKAKIPVKVLTQEDIDSGKYTISDIILPLPGYNIDYPPNLRDYYEELLTKDSITMDMKHKIKNYSMSGAYRHVVVRPERLSWQCVRYDDPYGDLILSDLDDMNGKQLTAITPDGKFKALLLTMSLPASCYATMALRELLKVDTSGDSQAQQNNYFKVDGGKVAEGVAAEESKAEGEDAAKGESAGGGESAESGAAGEQEVDEPSTERQEESNSDVLKRKLEEDEGESSDAKKAKTDE